MTYSEFFKKATDRDHPPYGWQERLATSEACESRLIDIPTGLGKTAGVILAWLWNRLKVEDGQESSWPRRLVYCLPMRTLVEQTEGEADKWIQNLWKARDSLGLSQTAIEELRWLSGNGDPQKAHSPIVLMGGEDISKDKREWDLYPEKPAILIGTQDMLLSRALNRGYGMSRYRWPMHFALLNNDALWIMDEVQLMGAGLASTTQMEGFRTELSLGSVHCMSWWMSATIRPDWLKTVDCPSDLLTTEPLALSTSEKEQGRVLALREAPKTLLSSDVSSGSKNVKAIAKLIAENHKDVGLNLVVVNTVKRARALHAELVKSSPSDADRPILLHSQFLPQDRLRVLDAIRSASPGTIVVSTQVIEAGVDLSAHTLFTELAPWSSLVQRFGRCNRWLIDGQPHFSDAHIFWFDLDPDKEALPYESEQLIEARNRLTELTNASIKNLESIQSPDADRPSYRHVIRKKDLVDLFDTTQDLAGADIDIDRFIRDANESNVQVFWRSWEGGPEKEPSADKSGKTVPVTPPQREELCSTGIGDLKTFLKKQGTAWRWDYLENRWQKADSIYPGQTYLLHRSQGGYGGAATQAVTLPTGWTGDGKDKPLFPISTPILTRPLKHPSNEADEASECDQWQTLAQHTDVVCDSLEEILLALEDSLPVLSDLLELPLLVVLKAVTRWHDWGKSHDAFQAKLDSDAISQANVAMPVAKAPERAWRKGRLPNRPKDEKDARRKHFRHEMASALGVLIADSGFPLTHPTDRDLAAYLIAAHHGKVRLSIRSLPDEWHPPSQQQRFARGIWDGDELPTVDLGCGHLSEKVSLSLEPMELGLCELPPFAGQPSWAERMLDLRDAVGLFALAYLETLIRAADGRGSAKNTSDLTAVNEDQGHYSSSPSLTESQIALAQAIADEGLAIQDRFRPEPLYKMTGKGHYESRTVEDIQAARKNQGGEK
jgi:CRISPR-associated endonuclease/helicase Cas3